MSIAVLFGKSVESRYSNNFLEHEGDPDALRVIKYMMDHPEFDLTPQPGAAVPRDYHAIAKAIDAADVSKSPEIVKFNQILEDSEEIIFNAFGLTKSESMYLRGRLEAAPFAAMQPRWPWTPAAIRATRVYEANDECLWQRNLTLALASDRVPRKEDCDGARDDGNQGRLEFGDGLA